MADLLPREPTPEMLMAGRKQCAADCLGPHLGPNVERIWQAMHDASPTIGAGDGELLQRLNEAIDAIEMLDEDGDPNLLRDCRDRIAALGNKGEA